VCDKRIVRLCSAQCTEAAALWPAIFVFTASPFTDNLQLDFPVSRSGGAESALRPARRAGPAGNCNGKVTVYGC
jgi:hypothetical protein